MQDLHPPVQRLDDENLDVYRCAIEFPAFAFQVVNSLQRGDGELRDQLKRPAISVVLNLAEGAGKPSAPDRARFHAIARASAMECGAPVDVRIVSMLTRMCR